MLLYGAATLANDHTYDLDGTVVVDDTTKQILTPEEFLRLADEEGLIDITGDGDLDNDECSWLVEDDKELKRILNGYEEVCDWLALQKHY